MTRRKRRNAKRKKLKQMSALAVAQTQVINPPKRNRIGEWARLIAITGSAQVIVQAIGFISGILVIRLLPTHEYALYTLANTMLSTMTVLADGGISTGVMSQGGKVWQDKQKLGAVLVTGLQLRKRFAFFSLLVAIPVLFYLLRKHDASWLMSGLIVLSIIPAFMSSLSGTLLDIIPKLHQDIAPMQKIQVFVNAIRLAMLGVTLFVYPFAAVAVVCAGLSQGLGNLQLRKFANRYADLTQSTVLQIRKEILSVVKLVMPNAVYYCISGQLTLWMISVFGSSESVAQVGALGRLAMILNLISVILGTLITPRYARLPNNKNLLLIRFLQIQFGLFAISAIVVSTVWFFPSEILWILGKDYARLTIEVVLMAAGSCMSMIAGCSAGLLSARALLLRPIIGLPFGISFTIAGIVLIDMSTTIGALSYSLYASTMATLFALISGIFLICKTQNEN